MTAEGRTAAIVPAAGRGERLGPGAPKALRLLGGAPLLVHAVRALNASHAVGLIVLAVPADQIDEVRVLLDEPGLATEFVIVAGGETRQESVIDYRPVHTYTMSNDIEYIAPKARVY